MVKVSVIIPVYNVAPYLERCIDSVLQQTLKDIQIICVNDGSTDNCGEILKKYADRVQIITQKNQGLSMARNNGMSCAVGEYIGFVDSDDWISPDFYEQLYNAAKNEAAEIAATANVQYIWDSKWTSESFAAKWIRRAVHEKSEILRRRDLCYSSACWNRIYSRDFLTKINALFPKDKKLEDFPFVFHTTMMANKTAIIDNSAVYWYYMRGNSIMSVGGWLPDFFDNIKESLRTVKNSGRGPILMKFWENIIKMYFTENYLGAVFDDRHNVQPKFLEQIRSFILSEHISADNPMTFDFNTAKQNLKKIKTYKN
jgi:glycosyltransferase involved in cell wall biosynthesis